MIHCCCCQQKSSVSSSYVYIYIYIAHIHIHRAYLRIPFSSTAKKVTIVQQLYQSHDHSQFLHVECAIAISHIQKRETATTRLHVNPYRSEGRICQ